MKIGFDAKRYYHNHTGLGNYSRTLVHNLQKYFPEEEYVLYDEKSFDRTFRLGNKAAQEGCDILHGLSNELPLNIGKARIPSVVTLHDVAWRTFPAMYHWTDRQIYDFKYGQSCKQATCVVAISQSTKQDAMRFYGIPEERIKVIYQPVQEQFYTPLPEAEIDEILQKQFGKEGIKDYILNVGSINRRKNLLNLVKALERIPKDQRPLLLVVGNGREYKREVLEYAEKHGLSNYLQIETNIFDSKILQALYSRASVMAYPSFYEGFGLPVVEAALQKCPVITSNVSSLPEAGGQGAALVDPNSVEEIASAIKDIIGNRQLANMLATTAEQYARAAFDPKELTSQMHHLYKSLIEGR